VQVTALCALVVGFLLRVAGVRWGALVVWAAMAVGIGVLTWQRHQGRL
jgi:hypothetical protein